MVTYVPFTNLLSYEDTHLHVSGFPFALGGMESVGGGECGAGQKLDVKLGTP